MADSPSELFDPAPGGRCRGSTSSTSPITAQSSTGTVRVAFDRPEVRNAFRPHTVDELYRALDHARMSPDVGCVLLTGNGPSPKDGGWAFCSGGDQRIRGRSGLPVRGRRDRRHRRPGRAGRLHILEVQRLIRFMPKVVICLVNGLGGRRRAQPARGVRPDAGQPRARPLQADRRRRRQLRRRLRQRVPGAAGRPEVRPGDLLPRPDVHRRADAPHGRGQRGRRPRRAGTTSRWSGRGRSTASRRRRSGCSSTRSTCSTTGWSASSCSPVRPPGWRT